MLLQCTLLLYYYVTGACDITGKWTVDIGGNVTWTVLKTTNEGFFWASAPDGQTTKLWRLSKRVPSRSITSTPGFNGQEATQGLLEGNCTVIDWQMNGESGKVAGRYWCRYNNPGCLSWNEHPEFWAGPDAKIMLIGVAHTDIFWLGEENDMLYDSKEINMALDLMNKDPNYRWQHEAVIVLRAYLAFFPERADELISRIKQGWFDIGGTFTEPFESTLFNEILIRQMYSGVKWVRTNFPELNNTARVAFHQDGPLRALQVPQIYAKAGIKYLKGSRYSNKLFRWASPDGSSLLTFEEDHYCYGFGDTKDIVARQNQWYAQYQTAKLPPISPQPLGCDYAPPGWNGITTKLFEELKNSSNMFAGKTPPPAEYANFIDFFKAIDRPGIPIVYGLRPNLWWPEASPTHHWMFSQFRQIGRDLPAAETWWTFRAISLDGGFENYPEDTLQAAWLNITINDHGFGHEKTPYNDNNTIPWLVNQNSPPHADEIYREKYQSVFDTTERLLSEAQKFFASEIIPAINDTRHITPVVLFNSLSWPRRSPVSLKIPSVVRGWFIIILSGDGEQILYVEDLDDPTTIHFLSPLVPGFGYTTVYLKWDKPGSIPSKWHLSEGRNNYENKYFSFDIRVGGLSSVVDLQTGKELFNTSKFSVGEWMALQYKQNGASETHTYRSSIPGSDFERLGNNTQFSSWTVQMSDIMTVFQTDPIPTKHSNVSLKIVAWSGIPRIDFYVSLHNWDNGFGVANRVVFPINARPGQRNVMYAEPFGKVRVGHDEAEHGEDDIWMINPGPDVKDFERGYAMRPREVGDWIFAEADGVGVLIASPDVGVWDWVDPTGSYEFTNPVLAPEMLMHTNSNMGPFLNESGDHHFKFSVFSTPALGKDGSLPPGWWKPAVEANNPLRPQIQDNPGDQLLDTGSFLTLDGEPENIWVTAVKKEDGVKKKGVVVRLFENDGVEKTTTKLNFVKKVAKISRTNIIELEAEEMAILDFDIGAWSIETFKADMEF